MQHTQSEASKAKAADAKAEAEKDEQQIKGKTPSDTLLRIAHALRAKAVWGYPQLAKVAEAFEEEARFLTPTHEVIATKDLLEKQVTEARANVAKAAAVLDNPAATAKEHTVALKDLQKPAVVTSKDAHPGETVGTAGASVAGH